MRSSLSTAIPPTCPRIQLPGSSFGHAGSTSYLGIDVDCCGAFVDRYAFDAASSLRGVCAAKTTAVTAPAMTTASRIRIFTSRDPRPRSAPMIRPRDDRVTNPKRLSDLRKLDPRVDSEV